MKLKALSVALTTALPLIFCASTAHAQVSGTSVKIGFITDMSGLYADLDGPGGTEAIKMAIADFGGKVLGKPIEIVSADHQNKPDIGAGIAAQWFDRDGVDLIIDVPTSSVALAVAGVAKAKNKLFVNVGAATAELTAGACAPSVIHYTYDTYMLAKSTGGATVKAGGTSWYFITADYAFGKQLQKDTTTFVVAAGGKVLGSSAYPFPGTSDFSSFLVQAQASGAKVLGLCNAGADTVNSIKQANEFSTMQIAAMLMFITDVNALGLEVAKGLHLTESFYWDLNDRSRAFTKRFVQRSPKNWPNMIHAGCYSGALHFLKAVAAIGVPAAKASGTAIAERMKATKVDDDAYQGSIREDGRGMFNAYLFEVKTPAESHGPWDYFKLLGTTPPAEAWRPLADGHCFYVKA
jgi:branched-chain amino acid transport system substrate-binding protein